MCTQYQDFNSMWQIRWNAFQEKQIWSGNVRAAIGDVLVTALCTFGAGEIAQIINDEVLMFR